MNTIDEIMLSTMIIGIISVIILPEPYVYVTAVAALVIETLSFLYAVTHLKEKGEG